jgi:hypothetical protein
MSTKTSKTLLNAAQAVLEKQVWDSNCDCAKCKSMRALEAAVILETERPPAPETFPVAEPMARPLWTALDDLYALVRKQDMDPEFRGRIERAIAMARWVPRGSEKAVDQRAIDANALADAHRMYEAEHGHPFSESEGA